jgi:hypothetical protein
MDYQQKKNPLARLGQFSLRSLLFGAVFIIALVVALCVDTAGVLEYCKVISGSSDSTLEMGAIITVASIAPFLAMGFSISADTVRNK